MWSMLTWIEYFDELGCTLGRGFAEAHRHLRQARAALHGELRTEGVSHITGGGFFENVPRCLPQGLSAKIDRAALRTPPSSRILQRQGGIDEHDMFNTFNMGVGMIVIVPQEEADKAIAALDCGAYAIGEIAEGGEQVVLW